MKTKVLAVHNDILVADTTARVLTTNGFEGQSASDGKTGLDLVYSFHPEVILSDMIMLGLDGIEFLERVRSDNTLSRTIFIFLTAVWDLGNVRYAMELGADDYLTLPYAIDELLQTINSRIKRRNQILGIFEQEPRQVKRLDHHIFISYAREDVEFMQLICESMEKDRLTFWTDDKLIPGTPAWTDAIAQAIEHTGCVVVILSPDAKRSDWVKRELEYANTFGIPIFPVIVKGNKQSAIPIELIRSQFIDIQDNFEFQVVKLLKAIREKIGIIG
jgi:DNA-binding response OmpR family regulator